MIRVLIVDDSRLVRELLATIISNDPGLEVVGTATDPYEARELIKQLDPDVITLDIEMPRMDGITFLKNLMRLRPIPVVMISTLTEKGAEITVEALEHGALDFIPKPKLGLQENLMEQAETICAKVKMAARVDVSIIESNFDWQQTLAEQQSLVQQGLGKVADDIRLIAIGASTGGPEAIKKVISSLPSRMPPIAVVVHMPAGFTQSFARRLDKFSELTVKELSSEREVLQHNHVYIAHGSKHLVVSREGKALVGCQDDSPPIHRHKPAVDALFNSVSEQIPGQAIGVLLTGMGIDGANGLKRMRDTGCHTIAQDKSSSVVWGMPRVASELDAASDVLPLVRIAKSLHELSYE